MTHELSAADIVEAQNGDEKTALAQAVVKSVIGDDGLPMFTNDDISQILNMSFKGLIRLNRAINEFNGAPADLTKN